MKDSKSPTGVGTTYVAEKFWPWVMAAVPVPVTQRYLRAHWDAVVDRTGLQEVSVTELRRLRTKLLEEEKERPPVRLLDDDARQEAQLLAQFLPALALTEHEGRRLLLRIVRG